MQPLQDPFWTEKNAWSFAQDNECCLYCDGEAYYQAFMQACEEATSTILIMGWDMHTQTALNPKWEPQENVRHWSLAAFLRRILRQRPQLHIYVLTWSPAPLYILEREKMQNFKFTRFCHPRLHFRSDAHHPVGGSHHEKLVVIDDELAFVGGIDLTIRRWDSCLHAACDPLRKDPDGHYYQPYHDTQLGFAGPSARELGVLFRERWKRASGKLIPMPGHARPRRHRPPTREAIAVFSGAPLALSLTYPSFRDMVEVKQIAQLYEDLLMKAKTRVLIETQYLTSHHVADVLCRVAAKEEGPEIVIILPERLGPWLEKRTMTHLQVQALTRIFACDTRRRIKIFYPYDQELVAIHKYLTVHSKMMVVDDDFLTLGSANLNNRSMGLDTECNVTIDARGRPPLQRAIRRAIASIIAHYANHDTEEALHQLERGWSLEQMIRAQSPVSPHKHLADFHLQPAPEEKFRWIDADLLDMDQPSALEIAMDRWGRMLGTLQRHLKIPPRVIALVITALAGPIIAAYYVVMFTPLPDNPWVLNLVPLTGIPEETHASALLFFPVLYVLACLLLAPINLLILFIASYFPAMQAFPYIILGVIGLVSLGYVTGRVVGRYFFPEFHGRQTLGGFATLCLLRVMPIAPHSLVNVAAGAARIPFLRFLAATLAGMAPGCIMLVVFQRCIINAFLEPSWTTFLPLFFLAFIASCVFRWSSHRFSNYGS